MYLKNYAKVIRSKNSGPFEITFDIIFTTKEQYEKFKKANILTKELVASLYNITRDKVLTLEKYDAANAYKITLPRPCPQGSIGETDMHCAQQYAPLLNIKLWDD
jgi:hypothetical protein